MSTETWTHSHLAWKKPFLSRTITRHTGSIFRQESKSLTSQCPLVIFSFWFTHADPSLLYWAPSKLWAFPRHISSDLWMNLKIILHLSVHIAHLLHSSLYLRVSSPKSHKTSFLRSVIWLHLNDHSFMQIVGQCQIIVLTQHSLIKLNGYLYWGVYILKISTKICVLWTNVIFVHG